MTSQQRRTSRGATRPAPRPRRRAQPHDRTNRRGRSVESQRKQPAKPRVKVNAQAPKRQRTPKSEPRPILRTLTKLAARAVLGLVILAVFVFGVFPTGSYVEQRNELKDAEQELLELQATNDALEDRVARLESDEEIEREARKNFDMGFPGEESYLILPPGG